MPPNKPPVKSVDPDEVDICWRVMKLDSRRTTFKMRPPAGMCSLAAKEAAGYKTEG